MLQSYFYTTNFSSCILLGAKWYALQYQQLSTKIKHFMISTKLHYIATTLQYKSTFKCILLPWWTKDEDTTKIIIALHFVKMYGKAIKWLDHHISTCIIQYHRIKHKPHIPWGAYPHTASIQLQLYSAFTVPTYSSLGKRKWNFHKEYINFFCAIFQAAKIWKIVLKLYEL